MKPSRKLIPTHILTFLILFFSSPCEGGPKRIVLFEVDGSPAEAYKYRVERVRAGDTIVFGNKEFKVEKVLSDGRDIFKGSQNMVVDIGGGKAIRFPLRNSLGAFHSIPSYLKAYETLKSSEIPIVRVFPDESHQNQFVVMEKLDVEFSLHELLSGKMRLDRRRSKKTQEELIEFAVKTWEFCKIGDFSYSQIVYVRKKGWHLIDFTANGIERLVPNEREHIFGKYDEYYTLNIKPQFPILPIQLRRRIGREIQKKRIAMRQLPTKCQELEIIANDISY